MNRITISLPKPILKRYVLNHFSELSIDEFFQVSKRIDIPAQYIGKNNVLSRDSKVLSYMLDINKNSFEYFKPEAFSIECINKIANLDAEIQDHHINEYPMLLQNAKICESIIKKFPVLFKKLDESQITENIISILENSNYTPDKEDINKSPLLLNNNSLLMNAFKNDPSMIVYFDSEKIKDKSVKSARERGFIASEEDLLKNIYLRNNTGIMEDAIKREPRLIRLLGENCFIALPLLREALEKYKITKEDFEKNPALAKNHPLMSMSALSEFYLYDARLPDEKKVKNIAKVLSNSHTLTTSDLPFLDSKFGGKADIGKINELLKYFDVSINENDLNIQQGYLQALDKIVDGIVNIRYTQNKFSFKYPNIVTLNDSLIQLFNNVKSTKNHELISEYVKELHSFIGESIPIELLKNEIEKYYNICVSNQSIDLSITNEFCNKILNQHRNHFMSNEKRKILADIEKKMKLTEKKKAIIFNGRKVSKIENIIKTSNYQQLGITEEQFMTEINNVINSIANNKDIRKYFIQFDISEINPILAELIPVFKYYGRLDEKSINYILMINNSEVSKFIVKKFEQIKFKYINSVTLTEEEFHISQQDKSKLGGLNQTNYVIGDGDRCITNLSELLVNLDEETITKILDNKDLIKDVSFLLPFINLIDELDIKTFTNILANYDRIKSKIISTIDAPENVDFTTIALKKIDDLISLANAYSSINDIALSALGRGIVSEIGEYYSSKYLEFYTQMASKQSGDIPPISLSTPNYYLESGIYSDPERLLIGKKPDKNSCIDLKPGACGVMTYNEVLLQNSGDVILIRDSQKRLVSRILLIRRGNVIQMVTGNDRFPIDLYKPVADQIIQQSIANNDNIDYVFVNYPSIKGSYCDGNYVLVEDRRFKNNFPHANFDGSVLLLSSKRKMQGFEEKELELDFDIKPKCSYQKPRKKISYKPTDSEITRLRALKIVMETNPETKENMSRSFEPFYSKKYAKVICGEDWYIAIKNDGTVEELALPIKDSRMLEEIKKIKDTLGIESKYEKLESMLTDEAAITNEVQGIKR